MSTSDQRGFALTTSMMLMALLMALLSAYFLVTMVELSTVGSAMARTRGFYAAEAGLNLRAEAIRTTFQGYGLPAGVAPPDPAGELPCSGDPGSGDYRCIDYELDRREVLTYVEEIEGNPRTLVVPRGEPFQNLSAYEYGYRVFSTAVGPKAFPEAILEMHFRSRLVPMFQFAVFYNRDLEMLPGPRMSLGGPVHSNGDLYVGSYDGLTIDGQTTVGGTLYRGRKSANECMAGGVQVYDPDDPLELPGCVDGRTEIGPHLTTPWNGMIRTGLEPVTVPEPEAFDPVPGAPYWDGADLRVVLDLDAPAGPAIEVRRADGTADGARTAALAGCTVDGEPVASYSHALYNHREHKTIHMLDVDVRGVLDCIHATGLLDGGHDLDDTTGGGMVWYLTVDGPDSSTFNDYGVRVRNGARLAAESGSAPEVGGLTVVTDQAAYIQGSYNATNKKPASVLADSLNVLSDNWSDDRSDDDLYSRPATPTEINAAFLAGMDVTGGAEGTAGQDIGNYNGGLENYPRLHENWAGTPLIYRGSFVTLYEARHVNGPWSYDSPYYTAPTRDWSFDTDFNDPARLPPMTPRFVYLKQELFVRHFEL